MQFTPAIIAITIIVCAIMTMATSWVYSALRYEESGASESWGCQKANRKITALLGVFYVLTIGLIMIPSERIGPVETLYYVMRVYTVIGLVWTSILVLVLMWGCGKKQRGR